MTTATAKPKRASKARERKTSANGMSLLAAAHQVLTQRGTALTWKELWNAIQEQGLWSSSAPTPINTLRAAVSIENRKRGLAARFKVEDAMVSARQG
jgi:hypothetical protein